MSESDAGSVTSSAGSGRFVGKGIKNTSENQAQSLEQFQSVLKNSDDKKAQHAAKSMSEEQLVPMDTGTGFKNVSDLTVIPTQTKQKFGFILSCWSRKNTRQEDLFNAIVTALMGDTMFCVALINNQWVFCSEDPGMIESSWCPFSKTMAFLFFYCLKLSGLDSTLSLTRFHQFLLCACETFASRDYQYSKDRWDRFFASAMTQGQVCNFNFTTDITNQAWEEAFKDCIFSEYVTIGFFYPDKTPQPSYELVQMLEKLTLKTEEEKRKAQKEQNEMELLIGFVNKRIQSSEERADSYEQALKAAKLALLSNIAVESKPSTTEFSSRPNKRPAAH